MLPIICDGKRFVSVMRDPFDNVTVPEHTFEEHEEIDFTVPDVTLTYFVLLDNMTIPIRVDIIHIDPVTPRPTYVENFPYAFNPSPIRVVALDIYNEDYKKNVGTRWKKIY